MKNKPVFIKSNFPEDLTVIPLFSLAVMGYVLLHLGLFINFGPMLSQISGCSYVTNYLSHPSVIRFLFYHNMILIVLTSLWYLFAFRAKPINKPYLVSYVSGIIVLSTLQYYLFLAVNISINWELKK